MRKNSDADVPSPTPPPPRPPPPCGGAGLRVEVIDTLSGLQCICTAIGSPAGIAGYSCTQQETSAGP